jgi:uncharacterized protein YegL
MLLPPSAPPRTAVATDNLNPKRLPVYLVLDTSYSMDGEPIEAVRMGLRALLSDLQSDPQALEAVWLSVITFDETTKQLVPLTAIDQFTEPDLNANGMTNLGEGLHLLLDCVDRESSPGDAKPLVFLLSDGYPTDDWEKAADEVKRRRLGNIIGCGMGPDADDAVLKRITDTVVRLQDTSASTIGAFMKWVSDCIFCHGFGLPPKAEVDPKTRRYPIYLLLGTSVSMAGEPIEAVRMGLKSLLSDFMSDPHALETCWLSVITFDQTAKVLVSLTAIDQFIEPELEPSSSHSRSLGAGLNLLLDCVDKEVRKPTPDMKGDYKPLVFIMTDGNPTDDGVWESAADKVKNRRLGTVVACAAGPDVDDKILKRITEAVIRLQDCSAGTLGAFMAWDSCEDSIKSY